MDKRISYYVIEDEDGIVRVVGYHSDDSADKFFTDVSRTLAFDDCTNETVLDIIWKGEEVHYAGWQPGMIYEFHNSQNEIIWSGSFSNWDH